MISKIQVLVGMIASGKSTYAKNAARMGVICMNDDTIVKAMHADDYTLYDKTLKVLYKTVENHIIGVALAMQRPVIVDRGLNVSREGRRRWLALAKSFDVPCEALLFKNEGPHVHASRRHVHASRRHANDSRGHDFNYWLEVAWRHDKDTVEPTVDEGFDVVYSVAWEDIKEGKVIL